MIKRYVRLFIFFVFTNTLIVSAQPISDTVINSKETGAYGFLYDWHSKNIGQLKGIDSTYECYVVFKIDTSGNVMDFSIKEIRICKIPETLKSYITKLFTSTYGKWPIQIKGSSKIVSDEMIWRITSEKINQSFQQRMKALHKFFLNGEDEIAKIFYKQNKVLERSLALDYYGSGDPCRGDSKQQQ